MQKHHSFFEWDPQQKTSLKIVADYNFLLISLISYSYL